MKLSTQITIAAAFFVAVLLTVRGANAQLLIPHVTVDVERLPDEAKLKLEGIDSLLADYLREQEWAGDDYNYDFEVDISIFFTDYSPDPALDKYKAKLVATNRSDVRFEDTRWEFGLRQPYQFRQGQFDAFKSVVDFYVWMLFGAEYDKLEKLGGRTYYEKARQIYLQSSGQIYYFGWDKRYDLLRESVDDKNQFARELVFFYDTGMYFDSDGDSEIAKDYLYYALVKLKKVSYDEQERFLEHNYREFAEALVRVGYPKGVTSLSAMDPTHREFYESLQQTELANPDSFPLPGEQVSYEVAPEPFADNPQPAFPEAAKKTGVSGVSGKVIAQILVNEIGEIAEFRIVSVQPEGMGFEEEVRKVVPLWKFTPAMQDGKAISVWVSVPFNFRQHR